MHGMAIGDRFETGRLVTTIAFRQAVIEACGGEVERTRDCIAELFARHAGGDWGMVDAAGRAFNEVGADTGDRVHSIYQLTTGTVVWVITDADHEVTTGLLPGDY